MLGSRRGRLGLHWDHVDISRTQRFCVNGKLRKNSQNIQNRVLLRNSKDIMLFSIFSGIYDRFLGFRCVLHRFDYWLYVNLMQITIRMVKRAISRPIFLIIATPEYSAFC